MTDQVWVDLGGAGLARSLVDPICDLYDRVFSVPPFFWRTDESRLHRERLLSLLDDETFGLTVALAGSRLVGFAYGFGLAADTRRWSRLSSPLPADVTTEWPGRTFMLFDLGVAEDQRRRGVGRRLHDRLLGSRPEQRATLSVEPEAVATKALYEVWGWRMVGQSVGGPSAAAPVFDVYLRDRLDDLRDAHARP